MCKLAAEVENGVLTKVQAKTHFAVHNAIWWQVLDDTVWKALVVDD